MSNAVQEQKTVFLTDCTRCGAPLRVIDDLPAETDISKSFQKGVTESFVVVPHKEEVNKPGEGSSDGQATWVAPFEKVCKVEQIMTLAAGQSQQDQPVCSECLKQVVAEVERLVEEAAEENRTYNEAYQRLQQEVENEEAVEAEISAMEQEEQELLAALEACKKEEQELLAELARQRQQEEQLQREEEDFWTRVAQYQLDLQDMEEERGATASAIRYASQELSRLRRSNVLNEMFQIAQDGPFGTINGFRMGRLHEQPVPWEEVNAAWGQACLLLDALVKKLRFPTSQSQYRLVPKGSFSSIKVGNKEFELYGCDGGLSNFFASSQFGSAMHAFLCYIQEVVSFLRRSTSLQLPFKIEKDKVGGFSVKGSHFDQDRWTKALKFMLLDLKYLIAVVESRDFASSRS